MTDTTQASTELVAIETEPDQSAPPSPAVATYSDITERRAGEELPVIPEQWRGARNIKATLRLHRRRYSHRTLFHGVRLPLVFWADHCRVPAPQITIGDGLREPVPF